MGRPADSRRLPICRIWSLDGDRRCCSWLLASDFSCCSWSRLQLGPIAYPYGSNAAGKRSPSCSWSSFPSPCFCGCGGSFLWNCSWSPLAGHCFCGCGRFFVWSHCGATRSRKKKLQRHPTAGGGEQTVLYITPPSEAKQDSYITMIDEEITVTDVQHSSHTSLYSYINTQT